MKSNRKKTLLALALLPALAIGPVFAGSHAPVDPSIVARQSLMRLYVHNISLLGGMAQGKVPYDATAAQKAADSLVTLTKVDQSRMWPPGTDNFELGKVTRALPQIWENFPDVIEKNMALTAGAAAMAAAAGGGLESLQGAMGGLGGACSACHKKYRAPKE